MTAMHQGYSRYQQMRRHKRKLKQKYLKSRYGHYTNAKLFADQKREDILSNDASWWYRNNPKYKRNDGFTYWYQLTISGRRQYAKKYSDKRIRQRFREMLATMDYVDIPAYRGKDHEKEYDYNWEVW